MRDNDMAVIAASPAASLLLAVMVVVSLIALFKLPQWIERGVFRPYWVARRNEWGTLVSSAFLHADLTHLFFNGFTFWAFGFGLERAIGTPKFVALFVFGLLVSDAVTWLRHHTEPGYRTLGASGAIGAVLFAS
ncbi:MAG: rhomboid family intramembrane serine protease, partial [Rubrivivax sp.]